ncbi:AAA family ATPase [Candidatus Woesearchaeota archaeon]|nr:AAA family ATPase [Candidatus Woesearchaeota archaeon]
MSLFKDTLSSDQTLFKNPVALDYDYMPKAIPYRENQQQAIASCIKPLFQRRNGRNIVITGKPGIGKTVATKHIFQELNEETDEIYPLFINCWQRNTSYKILLEMCEQMGYRLTHNKKTEELFAVVKQYINKQSAVFCFDEIDKVEDFDFLYMILEEIYRKSILLITNYHSFISQLDHRILSRLNPEHLVFEPYTAEETKGILQQRLEYAFHPNVWEDAAFSLVVQKTVALEDIRTGLYLLREAGTIAEDKSTKKVGVQHAQGALGKLSNFSINNPDQLEDDTRFILEIIKEHSGTKIGEIYKAYQEKGGAQSYKTFYRRVKKLEDGKYISVKTISGGSEGTTSFITYQNKEKKLTDF